MRTENSLFGKRDSFTRGKDFNYCRCSRLGELSSFRLMRHAFGASPQPSRENEYPPRRPGLSRPVTAMAQNSWSSLTQCSDPVHMASAGRMSTPRPSDKRTRSYRRARESPVCSSRFSCRLRIQARQFRGRCRRSKLLRGRFLRCQRWRGHWGIRISRSNLAAIPLSSA